MGTKELGIDGSIKGAIDEVDERDAEGGGHHRAAWELTAQTRAVSRARTLTEQTLRAWRINDPTDVDDIVLMVDELVTNAVVHGTGPIHLTLRVDGRRIAGEVGDGNPMAPPAPGAPPHVLDWAEAGRGLLLVAALATEFGAHPDGAGKTVWFTRLLSPLDSHPLTIDTPAS